VNSVNVAAYTSYVRNKVHFKASVALRHRAIK